MDFMTSTAPLVAVIAPLAAVSPSTMVMSCMWRLCPYLARIRKGHFYRRAERGTRQMTRLNPVGMESDNKVALCALAHRHNLAPCSECSRLGLIRHWTFKEQAIR